MNIDPKILGKIKKCLALSASSNEHEAAAALRQAQKLMAEYGVSQEALAGSEVGTGRAKSTACTNPAQWEHRLTHMLRTAFGCEAIIHTGWFNKAKNCNGALAEFVYIGLAHQATTAAYAHQVLSRQIVKSRVAFLKEWEANLLEQGYGQPRLADKIAAGESFCQGFVANVSKQVTELGGHPPQIAAAIASKKREMLGGDGVPSKGAARGSNNGAFAAGAAAGEKAYLHRPVDGVERLRLN